MSHHFTVHVTSLYCSCHITLLFISHQFTIHVTSLYCSYNITLLFMSHHFTVHVTSLYCLFHINSLFMSHHFTIHVTSLYCSCHITLLFMSHQFTVHVTSSCQSGWYILKFSGQHTYVWKTIKYVKIHLFYCKIKNSSSVVFELCLINNVWHSYYLCTIPNMKIKKNRNIMQQRMKTKEIIVNNRCETKKHLVDANV